jgi:hypothetical protein
MRLIICTLAFVLYSCNGFRSFNSITIRSRSSSLQASILNQGIISSTDGEGNLPSDEELQKILFVAEIAARKAGDLIRDNIGARVKYSKTNYKDVVTEIDLASQRVIEQVHLMHIRLLRYLHSVSRRLLMHSLLMDFSVKKV